MKTSTAFPLVFWCCVNIWLLGVAGAKTAGFASIECKFDKSASLLVNSSLEQSIANPPAFPRVLNPHLHPHIIDASFLFQRPVNSAYASGSTVLFGSKNIEVLVEYLMLPDFKLCDTLLGLPLDASSR